MMQAIPIEQIRHRQDARHRSDEALAALAESMEQVGQISPIRVRSIGSDLYEVVAGSHRLQAADLLGWTEIAAVVALDDDLHAELASIDENLVRAELSVVDRARQTARRKAIYMLLHPETAPGTPGVSRQVGDIGERTEAERFTANTAKATGHSERSVQRDAERGEKISDEALDVLRGTALDTGTYLDKLKRVPAEQQFETARQDLSEPRSGIDRRYQAAPPKPTPEASFVAFTAAADAIEGLDVSALIEGAGRQRSVLGQRASGIADQMAQILEGLS